MQRRQILQVSALSALAASMGLTRSAFAQAAGAIQFGCPVPMSGPFAANGKFADLGMKLAIEQYGKALNRPLAYRGQARHRCAQSAGSGAAARCALLCWRHSVG
jgi:branched-chain amino acid transport system substrate-binding protein